MQTPNIHFTGIQYKKVSPKVQEALSNNKAVQSLGENYDVLITQYQKQVKEPFGPVLEYGLKYVIKEIVPNLFHSKPKFCIKGKSEFALDLNKHKTLSSINKTITDDLVLEAELLTPQFFRDFTIIS